PFEAAAMPSLIQPMAAELANLKCERYEAHVAKDLGSYGLDKPYLRLAVTTVTKKEEEEKPKDKKENEPAEDKAEGAAQEKPKEGVLLMGKPTAEGAASRFAKLGDGEAVFVVGEKLLTAVDRTALDLLDRKLLALDTKTISRIQSTRAGEPLTL